MKKINFTYYIILYFCVCVCVYGQEESEDLAPSKEVPTEKINKDIDQKKETIEESSYQSKEVSQKKEADIKKYNQDYQTLSSYFLNFKNTIEKTYNQTKVQEKILERKNEKINQENNKTLSLLNTKNVNTYLNLYQVELVGAEEEKVLSKVGRQKLKAYFNNIKKETKNNQSSNPFAAIFVKELMFKKGEIDYDNIFVRLISALILVACENCFTYTGNYELEFKLHVPEECYSYDYDINNDESKPSPNEHNSREDKNDTRTQKPVSNPDLKYNTKGCIISETKNETKVHDIKIVKIVKSEAEAGKYKKGELLPFKAKITSIYRADDGKATIYTK